MLTIPQFLEFPNDGKTKELCNFFLSILEQKNKTLYLHSQQVSNYSVSISAKMGLPFDEVACIKTAALLHDIGHLAVPNTILSKYPYLSTREFSTYKNHSLAGASMLENIPEFSHIMKIILCHHENWDGTGYPNGLKGREIPLLARIARAVDIYYEITRGEPPEGQADLEGVISHLESASGSLLDPEISSAFVQVLKSQYGKYLQ